MSVSLIQSHDSLRNTTFDCDSLGIHFRVSTEHAFTGKRTLIHRWDSYTNQDVLISEWERHNFHSDVFKFVDPSTGGLKSVPVKTFLPRRSGLTKNEWKFVGDDGRKYMWKEKSNLKLFTLTPHDEEDEEIGKYHEKHYLINARKGSIELAHGYLAALPTIILTFLYVQEKRTEEAAAVAGAVA